MKDLLPWIVQINGEPGIVGYLNGKPFSAITVHSIADRIQSIYMITNPEKLSHIPDLLEAAKFIAGCP
jgi:RNA polymerase sigma-70 factor (ECF subfamily)